MPPAQTDAPMPAANADLATTWAYLEEGVDHIMTRLREGISYSKYMNLYTVAYNYCVSSRMHGNLDSSVGLGGRSESGVFVVLEPFTKHSFKYSRCKLDGLRSV